MTVPDSAGDTDEVPSVERHHRFVLPPRKSEPAVRRPSAKPRPQARRPSVTEDTLACPVLEGVDRRVRV